MDGIQGQDFCFYAWSYLKFAFEEVSLALGMNGFTEKHYTDISCQSYFSPTNYRVSFQALQPTFIIALFKLLSSLKTNKQNKNLYKVKENADLDTSCLLIGVMVFVSVVIRSNFLGLADLIP